MCVYGVLSAILIATKLNKLTFNYPFFYFTIRAIKFAKGQDS